MKFSKTERVGEYEVQGDSAIAYGWVLKEGARWYTRLYSDLSYDVDQDFAHKTRNAAGLALESQYETHMSAFVAMSSSLPAAKPSLYLRAKGWIYGLYGTTA